MINGLSMVNKGIPPLYVKPQYQFVFPSNLVGGFWKLLDL